MRTASCGLPWTVYCRVAGFAFAVSNCSTNHAANANSEAEPLTLMVWF